MSFFRTLRKRMADGVAVLAWKPRKGDFCVRGKLSTTWKRNAKCGCGSGLKYKRCCGK